MSIEACGSANAGGFGIAFLQQANDRTLPPDEPIVRHDIFSLDAPLAFQVSANSTVPLNAPNFRDGLSAAPQPRSPWSPQPGSVVDWTRQSPPALAPQSAPNSAASSPGSSPALSPVLLPQPAPVAQPALQFRASYLTRKEKVELLVQRMVECWVAARKHFNIRGMVAPAFYNFVHQDVWRLSEGGNYIPRLHPDLSPDYERSLTEVPVLKGYTVLKMSPRGNSSARFVALPLPMNIVNG